MTNYAREAFICALRSMARAGNSPKARTHRRSARFPRVMYYRFSILLPHRREEAQACWPVVAKAAALIVRTSAALPRHTGLLARAIAAVKPGLSAKAAPSALSPSRAAGLPFFISHVDDYLARARRHLHCRRGRPHSAGRQREVICSLEAGTTPSYGTSSPSTMRDARHAPASRLDMRALAPPSSASARRGAGFQARRVDLRRLSRFFR